MDPQAHIESDEVINDVDSMVEDSPTVGVVVMESTKVGLQRGFTFGAYSGIIISYIIRTCMIIWMTGAVKEISCQEHILVRTQIMSREVVVVLRNSLRIATVRILMKIIMPLWR